jgi:flavodoxin
MMEIKKLICAVAVLLGITSCNGQAQKKTESMEEKKIIVAFYSMNGNTKAVAEYIKSKTDADIYEIKTSEVYPKEWNEIVEIVGKRGKTYEPALIGDMPDVRKYDVVFIGTPCWWGTIANPVRSFLHKVDLSGKTIAPFMTHGTSGRKFQEMKKLCPNSTVLEGIGIYNRYQVETKVNSVENLGDYKPEVDKWLKSIGF